MLPDMTFHAGMKKRHESFISPRHHVNTTVAKTSTRSETRAALKSHAGMSSMSRLT